MKIPSGKFFAKIFIAMVVLSWAAYAGTAVGQKGDQVVAVVNGVKISNEDFDRNLAAAKQQFASIGWKESDGAKLADLKNKVLDRLIDVELLYQQSQKREIVVADEEFENGFAEFRKQFPKEEEFQKFLQDNGFSEEDLKEQFKKSMALKKLQMALRVEFTETVIVTDKEIKDFYDKNVEKFKNPEMVKASHILISFENDADEAAKKEARAQIEKIQKQLKAGDDFAELAKAHSACPSSANGGDLGFFGRGQMVKPFEDAAFGLKSGEVSDIVETSFGYHLIKLTDKKAEETQTIDDVKARISDWLRQQKIDSKFEQYIEKLKSGAKIERHLK